jgi:importin-5
MTQSNNASLRESAFKLVAGTRVLGMGGWQTDTVPKVLNGGLEDGESVDVSAFTILSARCYGPFVTVLRFQVRLSALPASAAFLLSSDQHQLAQSASLLVPMLDILPFIPQGQLHQFVSSLNRLAKLKFALFQPHLQPLLSFFSPRILLSTDGVSTPTESNPMPPSGTFTSSSEKSESSGDDAGGLDEEKETAMKAALEFMITLVEAGSGMANDIGPWISATMRGCLEGMGTLRNDVLDEWLDVDVCFFVCKV